MAYTYQDFENAANAAGLLGNFSQYDLDLARRYPEAGLSLLSLKQDYGNATTDEQRILANEAANQIRSSYGNYTGGIDGSKYYATGAASAGDFSPTKYGAEIDSVLSQIGSFGPFDYGATAPVYNNAYAQQQKALLDAVLNRPDFSWSKETDPTWSSYKKTYLREGDRATANALGQASAASGGRASSYAVNAATQAGDYYASQLGDIIPTLYQQAYDRYVQDYQMKLSDLGAVNTQEQLDYNRYLTDLGQFNADRNQAYNEYLNDYNMLQTYLGNLQGQDATVYSRYLDSVAQQQAERQYADQQAQQELENQMALAQLGGAYGDYAGLNGLGITPNTTNIYETALANAGRVTPVGSGGSTPAAQSNPGTPAGAPTGSSTIDATLSAQLRNLYPDGTVTNADDWNYLLSLYDEQTLNAAGYRYGAAGSGGGNENSGNWTGNPINLGFGPISDARLQELIGSGLVVTRTINGETQYQRANGTVGNPSGYLPQINLDSAANATGTGASLASVTDYDSAISYMKNVGVGSGVRAGLMTKSEWTRRKASLNQYGTGGAEVKNYNSYQDYVRDYCEYAAGT